MHFLKSGPLSFLKANEALTILCILVHSLKFTFELLLLSKHWDLSFMLFKRQRESISHSFSKAVINLTCTKESFILLSMYVFFGGPLQELEWKRERTENDLSSHVSRWATTSHYASSRFGFSHCVQCHSQGRRQWTTAEQMRNVMKVKGPPFFSRIYCSWGLVFICIFAQEVLQVY